MKYPKIQEAKAIDDTTLVIEFTNQDVKKIRDSSSFRDFNVCSASTTCFFKNFQVEPGAYVIVWNEEIDISEYELWKNGVILENEDLAGDRV